MSRKRNKPASRYDVQGNVEAQFMDADKTVLANKKGIADLLALERLEGEALFHAYDRLVSQVRMDTPITSELIRHIHAEIFRELYDWAGRWRTVVISKPGVVWPPPAYLDPAMQEYEASVLRRFTPTELKSDEQFCTAGGEIQGEFLAIHPFREGNARTIKLAFDLLAIQSGRRLLKYDMSDAGRDRYIDAARSALRKDYQPMVAVIREALAAADSGAQAEQGGGGASPP